MNSNYSSESLYFINLNNSKAKMITSKKQAATNPKFGLLYSSDDIKGTGGLKTAYMNPRTRTIPKISNILNS